MRYYPVPFSSKEEDKLIFNLSAKEVLIIGGGVIMGLLVAGISSVLMKTFMIFCLPMGIPFALLGTVLALKKVTYSGCEMAAGDYWILKYKFKQRDRHYLANTREEASEN